MKLLMLLWFKIITKIIYVKLTKIFFHIFNVLELILLAYFPGLYTAPENMEYDLKNFCCRMQDNTMTLKIIIASFGNI
jgi:hypothetical protein